MLKVMSSAGYSIVMPTQTRTSDTKDCNLLSLRTTLAVIPQSSPSVNVRGNTTRQNSPQQTFVLMPTPAQRGIAKGSNKLLRQKRTYSMSVTIDDDRMDSTLDNNSPTYKKFFKRADDTMDRVLNQIDFQKKFAKLPEFTPDHTKGSSNLPLTPVTLVRSLLEKHRTESPTDIGSAHQTPGLNSINSIFFGPNFNSNVVTEQDLADDVIPNSPLDDKSTSKKLLEQRRRLVCKLLDHAGLFPSAQEISTFQTAHRNIFHSKQSLILKIREVRQRIMNTMKNPDTPNAIIGNQSLLFN
uniref:BHLH domain-containing protein n=1 Tax=Heterorhabditis bacteriophora TaxID=37862 RepID=A0A1I7XN74_HETBA